MTRLKFSASKLSSKPAEVFEAARNGGAAIQMKRTNGEVMEEFILIPLTDEAIRYLHQEREIGHLIVFGEHTTEVVGCGFDRNKG